MFKTKEYSTAHKIVNLIKEKIREHNNVGKCRVHKNNVIELVFDPGPHAAYCGMRLCSGSGFENSLGDALKTFFGKGYETYQQLPDDTKDEIREIIATHYFNYLKEHDLIVYNYTRSKNKYVVNGNYRENVEIDYYTVGIIDKEMRSRGMPEILFPLLPIKAHDLLYPKVAPAAKMTSASVVPSSMFSESKSVPQINTGAVDVSKADATLLAMYNDL